MSSMVLVQNDRGQSVALVPISRAVSLWFKRAADVVRWFEDRILWQGPIVNDRGKVVVEKRILEQDGVIVHQNIVVIRMPAVIRVYGYLKYGRRASPAPTTENVAALYGYECQRCGKDIRAAHEKATKDHVVPLSRGGRDEWENVTCLCSACNGEKGDRLLAELGWRLRSAPRRPANRFELQLAKMGSIPEEWRLAITE